MRRKKIAVALPLIIPSLLLIGAQAFADGVAVNITNDGTEDILVTVYDTTVAPRIPILSQRLNGFTTLPLHLQADAAGQANVAWTAVTVDSDNRKCGHAIRTGLGDSSSVTVHADSMCGSDQPAPMAATYTE